MIDIQKLYDSAPPILQNLFLNAYSAKLYKERYGTDFKSISQHLSETQWYNKQQIEEYQTSKLVTLVNHCYATVPFYRDLFDSIKLKPNDINNLSDLHKIPILTKTIIRESGSKLLSVEKSNKTRKVMFGGTSGTTGTPLRIGWDQRMRIFNNAVDWRQKDWAGIKPGDRIAILLGRPIVSINRTAPPFWQYDFFQKFLWMSTFHLSQKNLNAYVNKLIQFKPKAIEGYPSTLLEVAKFILSSGANIQVKAIFSSSEPLLKQNREIIESAFNSKVFDFYGLAERTVFATQCEHHQGHHLNFEYGISELVDSNNIPSEESGHLVTTSLQNYGMPLLRYKVNDRTSFINEKCACGREMQRIKSITTKEEDIIYKVDGTPISPSLLTHPFKPIITIIKSQIIQTAPNCITIKVVKSNTYSPTDEKTLLSSFLQRVGLDMQVKIEYVNDIAREKSGKFKWVIGIKKNQ